MKRYWISIRRIKNHEFQKTPRHIRTTGLPWGDIYLRLGELCTESTQRIVKLSTSLLLQYLALASLANSQTVSVTVSGTTFSVPSAFLTMTASLNWFVLALNIQSLAMLIILRSSESIKHRLHGFSAGAYGLYCGQDEMFLSSPAFFSIFILDRTNVSSMLGNGTVLCFSTLLLPFFGAWIFLIELQLDILRNSTLVVHFLAALMGIAVLGFSLLYLIVFNIPVPVKKHSEMIRWILLSRLHPHGKHPKVSDWLAKNCQTDSLTTNSRRLRRCGRNQKASQK